MKIQVYQIDLTQTERLISQYLGESITENEKEIILQAARISIPVHAAFYGDDLLCIFGTVPQTALSDVAHLWMQHCPGLVKHKLIFMRESRKVTAKMLTLYSKIVGLCMNREAMIWLQWVGAEFGHPVNGAYPFEIVRT